MATQEVQQLEAAVAKLEALNFSEISTASAASSSLPRPDESCVAELISIASAWPEEQNEDEDLDDAAPLFLRLEEALLKLPDAAQQKAQRTLCQGDAPRGREKVVASFRPLRAEVSRRLAEWTNEFNDWLSEAGPQLGQAQHLGELLREVEGSPQLIWYRQCPKARVKAKFLMAVAGLVRALVEGNPLLKPLVEAHPALQSLAQKIVKRLFVLPSHGNILESWHEGRLACYNATLSLAAQRAADQLKDELQVSLVAAVRRSAGNPQGEDKSRPGPKAAPLEVQLREWPMSGCPLARALLEFLKARAADLGDFGRPSLREVPPHCLKPATLRNLLSRLDAFELVGPGPTCLVRLKFEAVAALTYKAVGTKPKARAGPPSPQEGSMSPPQERAGAQFEANMDAFDYSNVDLMSRLIRRGLLAGDESWRQSWTQFCWKKGISSRLSSRNSGVGPPQEILASFLQGHLPKLKRATWARSLLEDEGRGPNGPNASRSRDAREHRNGRDHEHRGRHRRCSASRERSWSSGGESRDRRRKKHRRRDKKYGDFFNKNMSPEVMMMRAQMMRAQMVGVSMVMNSMMGMQNIIPPAPPPPAPYASTAQSWPNGSAATSSSAPRARPAAPAAPAAQRPRSTALKALAAPARKQPASAIDMDDL